MVYTPTGAAFSVDVSSLRACKVQASWFNPLDGQYTTFNYTAPASGTVATFTPPQASDHVDWVLVLESGSK